MFKLQDRNEKRSCRSPDGIRMGSIWTHEKKRLNFRQIAYTEDMKMAESIHFW